MRIVRIYTSLVSSVQHHRSWPPAIPPHRRHGLWVGVLAVHLLAAWGLLALAPLHRPLAELAPVFVSLVAELRPPAPQPAPAAEPARRSAPTPAGPRAAPPPTRLEAVTAAAVPSAEAPTAVVPDTTVAVATPTARPASQASTAPPPARPTAPAPPPLPKTISISQVAYLSPPQLEYPHAARRMQEQGQVMVRVLVDAEGRPQQMSVTRSSGYDRLDEAALAAVRATRFKPYAENGIALPFWVVMPLVFELDN
jgi:protein TonB